MTAAAARHELLYDTEIALRLVDGEVRAMTGEGCGAEPASPTGPNLGVAATPSVLERANEEIHAVLRDLRENRAALEASTDGRQPAAVLTDMEARLVAITRLFDPVGPGAATPDAHEARPGVR